MKKISILTLIFTFGISFNLFAQLNTSTAQAIANEAIKYANTKTQNIAVTVLDADGNILSVLRSENAKPHTASVSYKKAFTAKIAGKNIASLMKEIKDSQDPETFIEQFMVKNLSNSNHDKIILLKGGLIIKKDDAIIGYIGVGGTPSSSLDDEIALYAINKVGLNN